MAGFKGKHPRNLPARFYKPIGQLVARWAFTELYVQSVIWHIWKLRDPKVARLLTWDLNAATKVELFSLLAPKWLTDSARQAELKAIANEATRLRELRNRVAHGLWTYKPGDRKRLLLAFIRRNSRIHPKAEVVTARDLARWADDLDKLNVRLQVFHRDLGAKIP